MTQFTGNGNVPRMLLPREAALKWNKKQWDAAREAAQMPFAPMGGANEDQPDFTTFTFKGANGLAAHYRFGTAGWVPTATGGVVVCWLDASRYGTGERPTPKLAKLIGAVPAKKWKPAAMRLRAIGKHVLAFHPFEKRDLGSWWIELELAPGDYEVHIAAAQKTAIGVFAFVRLTRIGMQAAAPEVKRQTTAERTAFRALAKQAKTLKWADTEGGPLVCLQDAARKLWTGDGPDYDRACKGALFKLLDVGKTQALVLGYPNATTWLALGKGSGMIVQGIAQAVANPRRRKASSSRNARPKRRTRAPVRRARVHRNLVTPKGLEPLFSP